MLTTSSGDGKSVRQKCGSEQEISDKEIGHWIEVSLDVEPGRYRMTVHTNPAPSGKWWQTGEKFATISKV